MLRSRWSHFINPSNHANFIISGSRCMLLAITSSQRATARKPRSFSALYSERVYNTSESPKVCPYVPVKFYNKTGAGKHSNWKMSSDMEDAYREAIRDLNSLQSNSQVLALAKYKKPENILPLFARQLQLAGIQVDDLDKLKAIHVSGTKGKGSTCTFVESILMASTDANGRKMKIGSYNSPHLVHVTERIRINGKPIDRDLFSRYFREIFDKLKRATERERISMPSYFAFLTILAFHIFLEERVDCSVIEVGMGGEYDPTNIIQKPVACAITTLDLDHTNILGDTIKSIAWTKAGIIKPGVPLYTVEHEQQEALEMIRSRAAERNSQVYICKPLRLLDSHDLGIKGPAQSINASVACQLASELLERLRDCSREDRVSAGSSLRALDLELHFQSLPESFQIGLKQSCLPGRCQIVETNYATHFLDGAHTSKSMENCLDWFFEASRELDQDANKFLMVNVIGERNRAQVLRPLLTKCHKFRQIIFTSNRISPANISRDSNHSESFARARGTNNEKSLENVKNNANVWLELVQESGMNDSNHKPQLIIQSSINESLHSIAGWMNNNTATNDGKSHGKPHILSTGSLHFVGALLATIDSFYPNKTNEH